THNSLGSNNNDAKAKNSEGTNISATRLVYTKGGNQFLGSDEFAIHYRFNTATAAQYNDSRYLGMLNVPIEIPYTINPLLTVSALVYPRYKFNELGDHNEFQIYNFAYFY